MRLHKLKNGKVIGYSDLIDMEKRGMRETEIAKKLGITRQGLYQIRMRYSWHKKIKRIGGGRGSRVPLETQRLSWNKYMRERYYRLKSVASQKKSKT